MRILSTNHLKLKKGGLYMSDSPLKKTIDQLLRAYGYQDQLDEIELIKIYKEQVGQLFANHTQQIAFKNNIFSHSIYF